MRDLWRRPGFRRLIIGQTVSAFGDWIATIGLMVLVLQVTGSSTAVGGVLVLRLAPAAVAGPLAARAVRRSDRRLTMLRMDAARAAMVAALPFLPHAWWSAPGWLGPICWVYLWAFATEVASLVFLPARDAAVPHLVGAGRPGGGDLGIANGLVLGSSYAMIPVGAAAFGGLLSLGGVLGLHGLQRFVVPFAFDALTFLVSYAAIAGIPSLGDRGRAPDRVQPAVAEPAPTRFRDALRLPLVRAVLPATAAVSLGVGALFSVGVRFVEDVLDATPTQFGVLIAVFGVGAATGLAASRLLGGPRLAHVRLGVAGQGVVIAAMSLAPTVWLAYVGALLFGAAATATLIAGMSVLQAELAGAERELAFTAFHVVVRVSLGIAAIGAGAVGDLLGDVRWPGLGGMASARVVLLVSGLLVLASAALVQAAAVRVAAIDEREDVHAT